jgi:predicted esterase
MSERTQVQGPHQGQQVIAAGRPLDQAQAAMILIHGRGASAYDILQLGVLLSGDDFAILAPQAAGNTWYPYSFLAPIPNNEPYLTSALQTISDLVAQVEVAGFSQGACLASEFTARNARRYGGLLAFSGGLIGPEGTPRDYPGSLNGTPVFTGCSDTDFHIPLARVNETAAVLSALGGDVNKKIYPGMGHTIIQDELNQAQKIVDSVLNGNS